MVYPPMINFSNPTLESSILSLISLSEPSLSNTSHSHTRSLIQNPHSPNSTQSTMRTSTFAILSFFLPSILALTSQPISLPRELGPDLKARQLFGGLGVYTGTCVQLAASLDLSAAAAAGDVAGAGGTVIADPGACLCVDTNTPVLGFPSSTVYVQTRGGVTAVVTGQTGSNLAGQVSGVGLGTGICTSVSLLPNTVPDYSRGCCARKCGDGFRNTGTVSSPNCVSCSGSTPNSFITTSGSQVCVATCTNNQIRNPDTGACTCPAPRTIVNGVCTLPVCSSTQVRQADGSCAAACPATQTRKADGTCGCTTGQILCNNQCYSSTGFTCASGIPTPKRKRSLRYQCGGGKTYCPAVGHSGWECIDTLNDIESCGGCADPSIPFGPGIGSDCTAIPGVNVVSCNKGQCVVDSCRAGFVHSDDGKSCVVNTTASSRVGGSGRVGLNQAVILR